MYQQGAPFTADLSVAVYLYQPGDGGLDRVAILLANHMARRGMKVELWMARTQGVSAHLIDPRVPVRRVAARQLAQHCRSMPACLLFAFSIRGGCLPYEASGGFVHF